MKKGNSLVIVLILVIVIIITVIATMIFTGVISFNNKTENNEKQDTPIKISSTIEGLTTPDAAKELNIDENKELVDELISRTVFSSYTNDMTDENNTFNGFYFYAFKGDKITIDNFSVSDRLAIAYSSFGNSEENNTEYMNSHLVPNKNAMYFSKIMMDEYINKIFGRVFDYQPSDFKLIGKTVQYDADKASWIIPLGLGGRFPYFLRAIYKVVDTGDAIELYEKAIYVDYEMTADNIDYTIVHLKNGKTDKMESQKFNNKNNWTMKDMNAYFKESTYVTGFDKVIMSNYYDEAGAYKHTFAKKTVQEDVTKPLTSITYYWRSSEKIK